MKQVVKCSVHDKFTQLYSTCSTTFQTCLTLGQYGCLSSFTKELQELTTTGHHEPILNFENFFQILFDKDDPHYVAGSQISGHIVVKVDETIPVRGIKLKLSGKMELYWRKVEDGATIEYAEIEDYLDDK